jgi:hypothetical protein
VGFADLHIHTTYSDGAATPAMVVERAIELGLAVIAVTDHDCIDGALEASVCEPGRCEVVIGEEVTTRQGHVLGLFLTRAVPADLDVEETANRGHAAALGPGRNRLFVAAPDGGIVILDLTSNAVLDRLTPDKRYASLGVSTDGAVVYAVDAGGGFNVIEIATGKTAVQRTGAGFGQLLQVNAGV